MGEGDFSTTFTVSGGQTPRGGELVATIQIVGPRYFEVLGVPLVEGRPFTDRDDGDAPGVAIINEAAARHWPDADAIGGHLEVSFRSSPTEVVGVVKDVRLDGLAEDAPPTLYLPAEQFAYNFMTVVLRTTTDPTTLLPAVRETVRQLDSEQPIHNARTMDELISTSVAQRRFQLGLLGAFSALALVLAVVGVYGVVSYAVSRRRTEIGVRMALGADQEAILIQVTGESMRLALIGVAIGIPVAVGVTRVLSAGLFGIGALDPMTYMTAAILLVLAVVLATVVPAWRAASTHPVEALRAE
jgi:predicted permease